MSYNLKIDIICIQGILWQLVIINKSKIIELIITNKNLTIKSGFNDLKVKIKNKLV